VGLGLLKAEIKRYNDIKILKKNNKGLLIGKKFITKNPQYIKCGENVVIGDNSKLLCWDSYQGQRNEKEPEIRIGNNFNATRGLTIQAVNKVTIGNNVLIASDVFIIDYNHGINPLLESYLNQPLGPCGGGVLIDDGVWIGNNAVILPDVHIGEKSIIGAGAIVTRDIPAYSIAVGNPAKVIKKYNFEQGNWKNI